MQILFLESELQWNDILHCRITIIVKGQGGVIPYLSIYICSYVAPCLLHSHPPQQLLTSTPPSTTHGSEDGEEEGKMEVREGLKEPQANVFLTLDFFFLFFNLMIDWGDKKPLFYCFLSAICCLELFLLDFSEDFLSGLFWDFLSEARWWAVLKWGRVDAVIGYEFYGALITFLTLHACPDFCFLFEVIEIIVMFDYLRWPSLMSILFCQKEVVVGGSNTMGI